MLNDLRYAVRMLLKNPGFTAVAILTLALGIGANTAIFSLIDAIMLRMMPVNNAEELVQLIKVDAKWGPGSFSHPNFERFRDHNQVFSGIFAVGGLSGLKVNLDGQTELAEGQLVSGTFYSVLGVHAILGRTLTASDDKVPRGYPLAVLSYSYWKRRFALDSSVVGKAIRLNQIPFTIIGVTPPEFFGVSVGRSPDIYVPMMMEPVFRSQESYLNDPNSGWLQIMARLKPGVSLRQAHADLAVIFGQTLTATPTSGLTSHDREDLLAQRLQVTPAGNGLSDLRRQFSESLLILMMVVVLVLLISCANVANLLLARATARQREVAVRLAIGAGRGRLIRQLLTESVLLAILGGTLGLLFANWTSDLLLTFMSRREAPIILDFQPDPRILGFTALASLLASVLFGLAPALRATRVNLVSSLKQDFRTGNVAGSRFSLGKILVVTQVVLSLLLLIGAGLFVRTLQNLRTLDAGFNRENVLLFSMDPRESGYKGIRIANRQVLERLNAIPGVRSAFLS